MPVRNNRRGQEPEEQKPDFGEDFDFLQDENERLRTKADNLKRAADEVAQENERLRQQQAGDAQDEPIPNAAGVLLLIVSIILAGRLFLYVFVEDYGRKAQTEGLITNIVSGAGTVVMLVAWVYVEWQSVQWLMIPKVVLVLVTLAIAVSAIRDGDPPLVIGLAAIGVLLFGASPFFIWLLRTMMHFLNDPIGFLEKLWK
jgi:hypothetical protein